MSGLFDKKTKQTANSTSTINSTTNRTAPDWITSPVQGFVDRIGDIGNLDPSAVTPGPTQLQTQGFNTALNLSGSPWAYDSASDLTRGVAQASAPQSKGVTAEGYIDRYMSPYINGVVNAASNDLTANEGNVRAAQDLDLAGSGAFGGSGAAITKSMTEGELARARASTLANLRNQGFTQALGAAEQDAAREQQTRDLNAQLRGQGQDRTLASAGQLAQLASAFGGDQRANAEAMANLGEQQRQIEVQQSPLDLLKQQIAMLGALPLDMFGGQTSTGTTTSSGSSTTKSGGSPLDKIGQALQIAAMFAGG